MAQYAQYQNYLQPSSQSSTHLGSISGSIPVQFLVILITIFHSTILIFFLLTAFDLELRTTGRAGEYQGPCLGVFQLHSEDEGEGRVYKQKHDGGTNYYMYR